MGWERPSSPGFGHRLHLAFTRQAASVTSLSILLRASELWPASEMSATDPKLGMFNPLRGDSIQCGPIPTLYHSESQHNSMVCRLGLTERGCEWRSRLVVVGLCEQVCDSSVP